MKKLIKKLCTNSVILNGVKNLKPILPFPYKGKEQVSCAKHTVTNLSTYRLKVLETYNTPLPWRGNRKVAFTLAEVLITLGIIGVVAAITIPALIDNYQKHEVPIRLKKMYNTLWNAIELAEIENGPSDNWLFSSDEEALNFYNNEIRSKMNCVAYKRSKNASEEKSCFLADGSLIKVNNTRSYGLFSFKFYPFTTKKALSYVAESQSPSKRYVFFYGLRLAPSGKLKAKTEILQMNEDVKLLTRDRLLNGPGPSTDQDAYCKGGYKGCFYVIKMDGWKIAPDYPW